MAANVPCCNGIDIKRSRGVPSLNTSLLPVANVQTQPFTGLLASGSLKSSNISGTAHEKKHSVRELKKKADQGNLYVLVNTTGHPVGELRGQFDKSM